MHRDDGVRWRRQMSLPFVRLWPVALLAVAGLLLYGGVARAALPDGRAWEMISPLDKNGGDIRGIEGIAAGGVVEATSDGEKITYTSTASFGASPQGASLGSQYLSGRHAGEGWLTQNVSLPMGAQIYGLTGVGTPFEAFSPDLSLGLVYGGRRGVLPNHPVESPPLAGSPPGYEDYYLDGLSGGVLQSLLTEAEAPKVPAEEFRIAFVSATPDLAHVAVVSPAALAEGAVELEGDENLYEWDREKGRFATINILPDGTPAPEPGGGFLLGTGSLSEVDHAISEDGSRVVWEDHNRLYLREDVGRPQSPIEGGDKCTVPSDACTVQVDASQEGPPGAGGGGTYVTANDGGSRIFFTDRNRLTSDPTASSGGFGDLYMFEPDRPEGQRLTDLTVDEAGAGVQGVLGTSEDGSYVYFVANGVLAPEAHLGDCEFPSAPAGATCNLYLWHEGETRFVATVASNDENGAGQYNETPSGERTLGLAFDWDNRLALRTARVSRDGKRLLFMSERNLTGYDNTVSVGSNCGGPGTTAQCQEVYLYEAGTNRLSCVSCNPNGARPIGPSGIQGGTSFSLRRALYQSRALAEEGPGTRVFFDSADALVPQDTNGTEDVYEYENGRVYLLSEGTNAGGARFVDASTNGDDVFFVTRAQLVSQDTDQLADLYDARAPHAPGEAVGFLAPPPPVACGGDDCRSAPPATPSLGTFSSATFIGPGNVAPSEESRPEAKSKPKKVKKKAKPKPRKAKRARKAHAGRGSGKARGARR